MTSDWESYLAKPGHRRLDDASLAECELRDAVFREVFGSAPFVFTLPICTPHGPLNVLIFDEPPQFELPLIVWAIGAPFHHALHLRDERSANGLPGRNAPPFPPRRAGDVCRQGCGAREPGPHSILLGSAQHYAKLPFLDDTVLAVGMVVPVVTLGQGQVRFLGGSNIAALIVAPAPDDFPEAELNSRLELDGDGVKLFYLAYNACHELVDVTLLRDRECPACRPTTQSSAYLGG